MNADNKKKAAKALHTKEIALSAPVWDFLDDLTRNLGITPAAAITLLVERYKASV